MDESISRRSILEGGEEIALGTQITGMNELYTSPQFEEEALVGQGISYLLIPKKRERKKGKVEKREEGEREKTIKIPPGIGPRYASVSGDYNPWHLNGVLAKAFGFPRTVVHGFYSASRVLAEFEGERNFSRVIFIFFFFFLQDRLEYPVRFEVEWRKLAFYPSELILSERMEGKKIEFELLSKDRTKVHLRGSIEHVPDMRLQKK